MRISMIRAGVVAVAASVALAACASHGVVPSSSSPGQPLGNMARGLTPAAPGLCGVKQQGWIFGGSCGVAMLKASGGKSALKAYKGISVKVVLGANTLSKTTPIIFRDATTPGKDIVGKVKGHAFPAYGGKAAPGKAVVYFAGINTGSAFAFTVTPGITIHKATGKYPGKTCVLGELTSKGWTATPLAGKVVGQNLIFPQFPDPAGLGIPKGPFFLAAACR